MEVISSEGKKGLRRGVGVITRLIYESCNIAKGHITVVNTALRLVGSQIEIVE